VNVTSRFPINSTRQKGGGYRGPANAEAEGSKIWGEEGHNQAFPILNSAGKELIFPGDFGVVRRGEEREKKIGRCP